MFTHFEDGACPKTEKVLVKAISQADMLIIGGTSLVVWPAAGLIDYFTGKHLVIINRDPSPRDSYADLVITDSIGEVFERIKV